MASYIRYDNVNDNKIIDVYNSVEDLIKCANEVYNENLSECKTYEDTIEVFESAGYGIEKVETKLTYDYEEPRCNFCEKDNYECLITSDICDGYQRCIDNFLKWNDELKDWNDELEEKNKKLTELIDILVKIIKDFSDKTGDKEYLRKALSKLGVGYEWRESNDK